MINTSVSTDQSVEALVGQLADEFVQRLNRGEQPDIEEYAQRYPEMDSVLRQVLAALQIVRPPAEASGATVAEGQVRGCLGDFRIVREVGRGGMGVVYEAEQISLCRRVALKVLPFAAAMDPKQLQRFRNEAQAAGQLHHQHIVPVYGVGCERGVHFYAMQYIDGQTLATTIRELRHERMGVNHAEPSPTEAKPCPSPSAGLAVTSPAGGLSTEHSTRRPGFFRTVARQGVQAATALEHAHGFGIVHRDIKPANLLVDARGDLWITDFGLARFHADAGLTMSGDLLGTIRYMSPEQALAKHGLVDHRTDIYSLGATLYELLTLQPACPGEDRQLVLRQIEREDPVAPRRLNPAIPADLETIVLKALAKEPATRFASARELADDLERFLENKPIRAKRPNLVERARMWSRRHRGVVTTAGVAIAVLLATVIVGLAVGIQRVREEQRQTDKERQTALRNQGRAEESYHLAREGLTECVRTVTSDPRLQSGELEEVRLAVLRAEANFYEKYLKLHANEPAFQADRASALMRFGKVTRELGNHQQSLDAFAQAVANLEGLHRADPAVPKYAGDLAQSYNDLAVQFKRMGQPNKAMQAYQKALALDQDLVRRFPNDAEHQSRLAVVDHNLGNLYRDMGRLLDAKSALQQAGDLFGYLQRTEPAAAPKYQSALANCFNNLGLVYEKLDRPGDAVAAYQQGIAIAQALVTGWPKVARYRSFLADLQNNLGTLLQRLGQPSEAELALRKALELRVPLIRDHPLVTQYRAFQGFTLASLAGLLAACGRLDEARDYSSQATTTLEAVLAKEPRQPRVAETLVGAYATQFKIANGLGRHAEALRALDRWLAMIPKGHRQNKTRLERAKTLAKLHRHADAIAEARDLFKQVKCNADGFAAFAALYGLAAAAARDEDPGLAEDYAANALDLLRQAIAAGYKEAAVLRRHSDFDSLRGRPDFEKLVNDLEKSQSFLPPTLDDDIHDGSLLELME